MLDKSWETCYNLTVLTHIVQLIRSKGDERDVITVDMRDRKPIYEQLIDNIRTLAVQGYLQPDEHLPSVRQLAADLAINPNTIQKAYAERERQNVIYALPGRGNFVSPNIGAIAREERARQLQTLRVQLAFARRAGVGREEIEALLDETYQIPTEERTGDINE